MPKKEEVTGFQQETLKNLRTDRGYNQANFAKQVGMHPSPYNRIERGKQEPTREEKIRIAKTLGLDSRTIWP